MGGSQKTTSTYTPNPAAMDNYKQAWDMSQAAAQTPFHEYGGQFTAGINDLQRQATGDITSSKNLYQPYFQQASDAAGAAGKPISVTPFSAQALEQYQNPFTKNVIDSTMAQMNQQQMRDQSALKGKQLMSGAFGGSRGSIDMGNLMRQQEMASGSTMAGLLSDRYNNAMRDFQGQQQMSLAEQQANRQGQMSAANLYSNLGTGANQMALQNAQALMGAGSLQQQTEQNDLSAIYNQFLAKQQYPFQTAQFLANSAQGLGSLMGGTTTAKTPKPFFSDERVKENIAIVGKSYDGQPIYKFNYKGDHNTRMGLMAQDVEKRQPEAVGDYNGIKTVDYGAATDEAAHRGRFAGGGTIDNNPFNFSAPEMPQAGSISYVPEQQQPAQSQQPQTATQGGGGGSSVMGDVLDVAKLGTSILGLFSDERVKENIEPIGESFSGQKIYRYSYKGDPSTHMGLIAQEVEKRQPEAVGDYNGIKTVDYEKATQEDVARGHFASGGAPISYVPEFGSAPTRQANIPQVPAYQKPTSVFEDFKTGVNQGKELWKMLPGPAKESIASLNPFSSGTPSPSSISSSPPPPPNTFGGGLFHNGGTARQGYDVGGSVPEEEEDKPEIPSALVGYNPLGATQFGIGSTPMPNPKPSAKDIFQKGLASLESANGTITKNPNSNAQGVYQFTPSTWKDFIGRHPELGYTQSDISDSEKQKAALPVWTGDLSNNLKKNGVEETGGNIYASHFLGMGGGPRFSKAAQEEPNAPAYMNATPEAVNANKNIFFEKDGTPRSTGQVAQIFQQSIEGGKGWDMRTGDRANLSVPRPPADLTSQGSFPSSSRLDSGSNTPSGGAPAAPEEEGGLFSVGSKGLSATQKGLLTGLFGMLGSQNTTFLGSLGEGGLKGMGAYESGQNMDVSRDLNRANLERTLAQTGLEKQRLAFEQQKLPYELQQTMAQTSAQRARAASELAKTMNFTQSFDPTTKQIVFVGPAGQTYTREQMGKVYESMLQPIYQSVLGPTAQMPSLSPSNMTNSSPPLSKPLESMPASPPVDQSSSLKVASNANTSIPNQQASVAPSKGHVEADFYQKNNIPNDKNPLALKRDAQEARTMADLIRNQPFVSPQMKTQMDAFNEQAKDLDLRAKSIEDTGRTQTATGEDIAISPLIELKNNQKAQEIYSQELPKTNKEILDKSEEEAKAAKNIYATTKNIRNLIYDDSKNEYKFKTGSAEGARSTISNLLATFGIDEVTDESGKKVSLAKMLTGVEPGDNKMLAHIMTLATPEMTKYQIPGQRFTQGELMQIASGNISGDMLPRVILEMIDTQILPGTKYKMDKYKHISSASNDKATSDLRSISEKYDEDHPLETAYDEAKRTFDSKKDALPSQSPFSETGKGVGLIAKKAIGPDRAPPPQLNNEPQNKASAPPSTSLPRSLNKNGHTFELQTDGTYKLTPAVSSASRTD